MRITRAEALIYKKKPDYPRWAR